MVNLNEEKLQEIKKYAKENFVPILQDESLKFIQTILEIKKPESILEIGTAIGYSAIMFSKHLAENGYIYTVELNEDTAKIARNNVIDMGLEDIIQVVNADGEQEMKNLVAEMLTFDVIFIDAAKGQYMKYLELALKLSEPGTLIIADNVLFKGKVLSDYNEHKHRTAVNRLREYIKEVEQNENLQTTILNVGDGVALSVVI